MIWTVKTRLSCCIGMPLAPKYVGVEVSKEGVVYNYSVISINDEYKPKKALISKILGIADNLNGDSGLKKE